MLLLFKQKWNESYLIKRQKKGNKKLKYIQSEKIRYQKRNGGINSYDKEILLKCILNIIII